MPLENLQRSIETEAKSHKELILQEAKAEAAKIIAQANENARLLEEHVKAVLQEDLAKIEREYKANLETEARKKMLTAREDVMERLMKGIEKQFAGQIMQNQKKLFSNAIKQAKSLGMGDFLVEANKKDHRMLEGLGVKKSSIKESSIHGGMIIYSGDGKIKLDASIGNLFDTYYQTIKSMLAKEIFEDSKINVEVQEKKARPLSKNTKAKKKAKKKRV